MELKEYLKIINKGKKIILLVSILGCLSGFIYAKFRDIYYESSLALSISRANSQQTEDYQYDGYYMIQASELFADTVKEWIESPEVVTNIFKEAGISLEASSLGSLTKKFKAAKMSSQYIEVRYKTKNREDAEKLSSSMMSILQGKSHVLGWASRNQVSFSILGSSPIVIENKPNLLLCMVFGLLCGIFLGLNAVFFRNYLNE